MADKKNILVLFDGQHLAFSPTVTQLYDMLSVDHTVTILAENSTGFIKEKLTGRNVIDYRVIRRKPTFIYKVYYFLLAVFGGVLCIGFLNFLVSFSLAFLVAVKSRGIRFAQYPRFFRILGKYFLRHPREFILAPKKVVEPVYKPLGK